MSKDNDDFVEDLLKALPKAEPISEIEIRKFEKLIDRQTEEFKKSKQKRGFKLPMSVAASIAIAFGAVFLLSNHETIVKPNEVNTQTNSNLPSAGSTQGGNAKAPSTGVPGTQNSGQPKKSQTAGSSTEVFGNSNSKAGSDGKVAKFETNLDYSTDLSKIKTLVMPGLKPGSLSSLDNVAQQCSIKQGISTSILAFDKGYFQGQRVSAYFFGSNRNDYKIILVDADCALISELSP